MWYITSRLGDKLSDPCRLGRFILDNLISSSRFHFFCFLSCIAIKVLAVRSKEFACFSCLVERLDKVLCRWRSWLLFSRRIAWYKFVFGMTSRTQRNCLILIFLASLPCVKTRESGEISNSCIGTGFCCSGFDGITDAITSSLELCSPLRNCKSQNVIRDDGHTMY